MRIPRTGGTDMDVIPLSLSHYPLRHLSLLASSYPDLRRHARVTSPRRVPHARPVSRFSPSRCCAGPIRDARAARRFPRRGWLSYRIVSPVDRRLANVQCSPPWACRSRSKTSPSCCGGRRAASDGLLRAVVRARARCSRPQLVGSSWPSASPRSLRVHWRVVRESSCPTAQIGSFLSDGHRYDQI